MELHTDDLAIDGRTRREQEIENFKKIINEAADLHDEINQEIKDRQAADATERNERINADTTERNERMAADNIERSERINADDIERQERTNKDQLLQQKIISLRTDVDDLQGRMKTAEDTINELYEAVFGIPSVILNEASSVDDDDNDDQPLQEINTERNGFLDAQ